LDLIIPFVQGVSWQLLAARIRQDWAGRSSAVGGAGSENISMYSTNAIVASRSTWRSEPAHRIPSAASSGAKRFLCAWQTGLRC